MMFCSNFFHSFDNSVFSWIEFVESVYYLYRATKDPVYISMAVDVLTSIEQTTKTSCGYATVSIWICVDFCVHRCLHSNQKITFIISSRYTERISLKT